MRSSSSLRCFLLLVVALVAPDLARAKDETATPEEKPTFSQAQLDQMLAPIALDPDSLLSQILMASPYPADVAAAAAWSQANPKQQGDDAVKAFDPDDRWTAVPGEFLAVTSDA